MVRDFNTNDTTDSRRHDDTKIGSSGKRSKLRTCVTTQNKAKWNYNSIQHWIGITLNWKAIWKHNFLPCFLHLLARLRECFGSGLDMFWCRFGSYKAWLQGIEVVEELLCMNMKRFMQNSGFWFIWAWLHGSMARLWHVSDLDRGWRWWLGVCQGGRGAIGGGQGHLRWWWWRLGG